ncbi:non-ribosomal peptide synthetase [Calothrix rhizosoleniae]|uniref:non-ribosomal peptide synthetase n=1 Tax=Calothrix rhizosoleniae TaxID=888997 RepID=UPI002E139064|nr:non-ribosomal peptide synthetase [Calothrix rhizosoleniae]
MGRYLADGNIEFLGRIDNQVKVRGFRIELGEVEAALNTHPQVTQTVVITTEEHPGNKRLVAYVVIEQSLTKKELRDYLKTQIPEYMVPSTFVTLDTLPLTPNGKIDRKALPAPNLEERENPYIEPGTKIEKTLAEIWCELLLIEKIGINDNFFEIGGDSILSIQVVSRAKNAGIQISAKQIFQHQTIAELARVAGSVTAVECNQGTVTGSAPLTPIQEWFLAENKVEAHHYNQSVILQIPANTKPELIEKALFKLISHHDALRLKFPSLSEHQQINYGLESTVPFNVIDLSSTPQFEQLQQIETIAAEYQASLNISTGPIIQAVLFKLGENENGRLVIIIHHLVIDGVSWRILLSDLQTIYQQLINQEPVKLEAKTTAFIDWAQKLNQYANSDAIQTELEYWCNQPWNEITPLPLDYPSQKQSNIIDTAVNYSVKLNQSETKALLGKVNEAYNTQINDILLSALAISCSNWTGNSTIAIDLEGHGREEIFDDVDLSRTVGWFTSLFPVLLQLSKGYQNKISDVIKSIKEQLRAIPNRGIGYGILRYLRESSPQTEQLQTTPTPEICFNYLGQFDQVQSESDWKFGTESIGDNESPKQNCEYLLEINSLVVEGCLQLNWTYSSKVHDSETVENLAQNYIVALKSIIEHCQLPSSLAYTPSDFPDAGLNQLELDELLTTIKTINQTNLKNISSIYPLSPTQQGMLFHSFYAPESGVYFEQTSLNIKGNLDIVAFKSAWHKVVDRYSILRTLFIWENRQIPLQVVLKQVKLPFENLDWINFSQTEQQQKLENLLQTHREQGFNFNQAPVMNCTLVRLTEDSYQFIWNYHHVLMDAWCLSIIFKEVLSFYETSVSGEVLHLPSPRPYQDYITWLNQQDDEKAKSFWQNTLQGFSAPTPLVVDKKQSQIEADDSDYCQIGLRLSEKVSQKLQDLSVKSHLTVSTIVQAAWALLLSRYSGEDDVLFGVTVSGRPGDLSGVEEMVGLFINTLPLRVRVSPQMSLTAWMEQVQNSIIQLQEYSYTPLVEIQAISEIPAQTPLFDSILVFENNSFDTSELNDICPLELNEGEGFERVNYPLTLTVAASKQLSMNIGYDTDCFDGDTIERMLGHLQTILCSIADNPQQQLNELLLLSQKERRQLLTEWNNTAMDYPTNKCVHQLFEKQVEKTPDAVAVSFEGEELSYIELNQRANQLAHHLQSLGVKPEVLVGICLERSIDMVVSVLAVLKAGAAYVPVDPNYPQERINYILDDAAVEILITKTSLIYCLPTNETKLVLIDDNQFASTASCSNPVNKTNPNNLAYVIYTSGSTGKPKATMIEHRGCVNHCYAMIDTLELKATDTIAQTAPIGFDISVWQILTILLVGGRVSVIQNEIIQEPSRFFEEIEAEEITVVQVVPSLLATMLDICDHWGAKNLSHLRWLSVTGEAFNANLMHWWFKYYPSIPLLNAYGPAECSDDVTLYPIRFGDNSQLLNSNTIPIGKPIANTQIYILDAHLNPVPIGVPGELYVGGVGVGRGYLNRPQLTSERFIANPFSSNPEAKLYKTGDLGCYLPDGNIEFLGRIDNQVKVRGFRIELGEIEAAINIHPQVNQAVVTTIEELSGNKRLVAYVVTEQSLTNKELRDYLKSQIPEYMVPSAFVTLDALPLTPNGKVDRKALQTIDVDIIERENQYIPPRTAVELELTQIWSSVIGITPIGVKDNFFDLGGHSLLAVRLISAIQTHLEVNLPLATLFQTPTIEELAVTIDSASSENLWSSLVPIQPKGSLPPLFFVGGEGGNVLCFQGLAQYLENQPFYGLEPLGLDGVTEPLGSIGEIADHYIKTIKSIQPVGPYYLGGHSFGGTVAFEMAQQLQNQGEEIAYIAILDSDPPTTEVNHEDDKLNRDDDSRWINELVPMIEELFETNLQISDETLASIPPEKQLNYFKQQLEMVGILPPQSDIKLVRGLLQVYRTQSQIEIDYVPQNTKPTAIALFCAQETDSGEKDCERLLELQKAALGWNRLSQREVEIHTVPGNHISMLNEPNVKVLAQTLQKSLEQTRISLEEEQQKQVNSK